MNKRTALHVVIFIWAISATAQERRIRTNENSLTGFYCIANPIGSYNDNSSSKFPGPEGFAKSGYSIGLQYQRLMKNIVGLHLQYRYTENAFDHEALFQNSGVTNGNVDITVEKWKINSFEIGLYLNLVLDKGKGKWIFKPRTSIGIGFSKFPTINLQETDTSSGMTANIKISSPASNGLSMSIGGVLEWNLSESFYLIGNIDYYYAGMKFKITESLTIQPNQGYNFNFIVHKSQAFEVMNMGIGAGIRF